ncbi:polyhydroxyalkanoate synthesis regulator DNA-binding domain-containing protein [Haliangium sp.]|uniref:polyhydroxyalkanoate synthesis regulator DNA-binding domain-containing protein n=1 Tax=Haliangium sp. TaxID=2663208 RepID=UPI003D0CED01
MSEPILIKKYGNRRLYDTGDSRYITLDELSRKIRSGVDVRVVDAKSGDDLTQVTLTQIIVEGRGAARLLPIPLLMQLIRLGDDSLAEFFGRHLSDALALYLDMKRGASAMARYNPFAAMPFVASDALARMWMGGAFGASRVAEPPPVWQPSGDGDDDDGGPGDGSHLAPVVTPPSHAGAPNPSSPGSAADHDAQLAMLRQELEELKRSLMQRNQAEDEGEPSPTPRSRKRKSG